MTDAIDLTREQRNTLSALLRRFLPGVAVWAYGSRVKWTARPNSDLDLVAFATPAQRPQVADLKEALAESNLPFPVDLHVWDEVPERFREIIREEYVVVQEAKQPESGSGGLGITDKWRSCTIGELCDAGIVELQTGPFGTQLHAHDYVKDGVPVVPTEAIRNRQIDHSVLPKISPGKAEELARHRLELDDILFARRGVQATGHIGYVREAEYGFLCGTGAIRLRVRRGGSSVNPDFLSHVLANPASVEWFKFHAIGATMPNLNEGIIRSFPLQIPPFPEQLAIAHILSTLDDKIELNRRINETLEAMARALFKSWFVDFLPVRANMEARNRKARTQTGDPVRAKAEARDPLPAPQSEAARQAGGLPKPLADLFPDSFEDTELGEIPKGWRACVLGEEVTRCGGRIQTGPFGSQLHASDYVADGVPVVMPKDLLQRRVSTLSIARVKLSDAERLSRHRLREGDIVYSRRGDVERHGLVRSRETGWLCGTGCLLVRFGPEWPSPLFASIALDRPETRAWIVQHAIGATMPNLNTGILASVPIIVPSDKLLRAFNRVAQPLADRVIASDAQTETLVSLRDSLLPKLISGELRVAMVKGLVEATA